MSDFRIDSLFFKSILLAGVLYKEYTVKDFHDLIDALVEQCVRIYAELAMIHPSHYLLEFDIDGSNEEECQQIISRFLLLFGPAEMDRLRPTTEDYVFVFENYRNALQEALAFQTMLLCINSAMSNTGTTHKPSGTK